MCGFESRPGHAFTRGNALVRCDELKIECADAHAMRTTILTSMAQGSVSRRSGGWCYRLDAGLQPATGRRHQISRQGFTTKRDAVAALNEALTDVNATSEATAAGGLNVRDYLSEWLDGQRRYLRASTLHSYRIAVDRIIARLGDIQLSALAPARVQRLQTDLLTAGGRDGRPLAAKTVANTHVVLHKSLADAVRLGLLDHNV